MKAKKIELDIDFIGGLGPLTKEEEKALSDFFKAKKVMKENKRKTANPSVKKRIKQPA
jgi:hypothetical protein